jgi:hypothetical protein
MKLSIHLRYVPAPGLQLFACSKHRGPVATVISGTSSQPTTGLLSSCLRDLVASPAHMAPPLPSVECVVEVTTAFILETYIANQASQEILERLSLIAIIVK